jgi:hypothetical protein
MFGFLCGKRATTKSDVILGFAGAAMAVWKSFDIYRQYNHEQDETKENDK